MKVEGYKADNYSATYGPALFDIRKGAENSERCAVVIEDVGTGTEFIFELEKNTELYQMFDANMKEKPRTRAWKKMDPIQEKHQVVVTLGKAYDPEQK